MDVKEVGQMPIGEAMSSSVGAPNRKARLVILATLLALLAPLVGTAGGAAAKTGPELTPDEKRDVVLETLARAPKAPPSPDDPFGALHDKETARDAAAIKRLDATTASDVANVAFLEATKAQERAQAAYDAAVARRNAARRQLAIERKRLSDLTVRAYVTGGTTEVDTYRAYLDGDTTDPASGRELMFNQVLQRQEDVTETARKTLVKAIAAMNAAHAVLEAAIADANAKGAEAQRMAAAKKDAEDRHEQALRDVETAKSRLASAGRRGIGVVPAESALIGIPRLSAQDLAGWFARSAYRPRVSTPIASYAQWFIDEGAAEGIRGDIAFAQAVLETGGFTNNDSVFANNFSGIGHCDTCAGGWAFPSPQAGVRAQIQLLKSYAISGPKYVNPLVDSRLRGPSGCCPTWGNLTTVWATDPTYGPKVMLIYTDIVSYALSRRASGQGFDEPHPIAPFKP